MSARHSGFAKNEEKRKSETGTEAANFISGVHFNACVDTMNMST
jgi:hypothetical protein